MVFGPLSCVAAFLRMGGTSEIDRLTLVPLRGLRASQIREAFRAFDVREARCSVEETTQLLLGVVESGFGDLHVFNSLVRSIFADRIVDDDDDDERRGADVERGLLPARARTRKASRKMSDPKCPARTQVV